MIFALWLMMAGIWLPNILQVVWWRFNAWGYLSSWMANLGVSWLVVWVLPAFGVIPPLPEYLQFWLLMGAGGADLPAGHAAHAAGADGPAGGLLRDDAAPRLVGAGARGGRPARVDREAAAHGGPRSAVR